VTRALRWILLLVILGGAAFLVFYLLQDIQETPQPQKVIDKSGDQLTEEDRRGLDSLIESKTREKEGDPSP
jgi:hypothetical protein